MTECRQHTWLLFIQDTFYVLILPLFQDNVQLFDYMAKLNFNFEMKWNNTPLCVPRSLENILSLSCSKALNVLDTDSWKWELLLSKVLWAVTLQLHEAISWRKSHVGTWTACFSSVNCAMIRFFKECMVHTTRLSETLWEGPLESIFTNFW